MGLHRGEDTEFYLRKGFSVVAVEAHPGLANLASEKLASYIASGQLTVVNKAVADHEGEVTLFTHQDASIWGTTDPTWANRNRLKGIRIQEISVPSIRFNSLIATFGVPYYLKIDIEGADKLCLRGLADVIEGDRPKFVSIESSKVSFADLVEEFCLLRHLGYNKYQVVP
jgi:FkbM family methyltransferase